jgi:hypothetical protein
LEGRRLAGARLTSRGFGIEQKVRTPFRPNPAPSRYSHDGTVAPIQPHHPVYNEGCSIQGKAIIRLAQRTIQCSSKFCTANAAKRIHVPQLILNFTGSGQRRSLSLLHSWEAGPAYSCYPSRLANRDRCSLPSSVALKPWLPWSWPTRSPCQGASPCFGPPAWAERWNGTALRPSSPAVPAPPVRVGYRTEGHDMRFGTARGRRRTSRYGSARMTGRSGSPSDEDRRGRWCSFVGAPQCPPGQGDPAHPAGKRR